MLSSSAMVLMLLIGLLLTKYLLDSPARQKRSLLALIMMVTLFMGGCFTPVATTSKPAEGGELEVHFIDVGQGDSILIKNGEQAMLIDTGSKNSSIKLKKYLDEQGIKKLEYLVGTNPLIDHIGGMSDIIDNYDLSWMILPRIEGLNQTYKDLQMRLLAKHIKPIFAEPGKSYPMGDASFSLLTPSRSSYDHLADYSVVIKLEYGESSFLFCSDAGQISEQEMLDLEFDLAANVLKVGRHGSCSSSCETFLEAVNPDYAVISVGQDNPYLHPHMETMLKLHDNNIPVYRTDEQGTIVAVSDGKNITFKVEPGSYTWPEIKVTEDPSQAVGDGEVIKEEDLQKPVMVNESSNKYHERGCSFLDDKCVEITLEQAREAGYEPCLLCKP
ncbi:MAG: MBL fold metallo-hydrolase [Syntrophomonadaceae bacterium]|jgi:beta-lactamase superfamily II metal-dependent hydrolase|nr:MBL fold metallo-hydrolase [Syntrophomonadaceae bacterium]